jgi:hypothetical protein
MIHTETPSPPPVASLPQRVGRLAAFGPPPLIGGEDGAAYDELLARVSGAVQPADIFEDIWLRDVVDLVWEALRYRRLKVALMNIAAGGGLVRVLGPLLAAPDPDSEPDSEPASDPAAAETQPSGRELAARWVARDRDALAQVDQLFAESGLSMDVIMSQALSSKLDHVERIDRLIMAAEARRDAVLREIDRHRSSLALRLRRAAQQAEDAEFTVIEEGSVANGSFA